MPSSSSDVRSLPAPWLLCALFAVALLPLAGWYLVHHPDERHYTDAGIVMVQTGDWLTPRAADGALRFNKPILPYWCVAASYSIFGINPFASRLPFLLAGCGTILATYRLGKLVGESEAAGRWAALVAVGNLQIVLAATRSIPDILLCLFTTISVWGVLSIAVYRRRNWQSFAAAYIGLGLAIASKGVPAVIVVGSVTACALWYAGQLREIRQLLHWPTMTCGGLIAGGWFVAMYFLHGEAALSQFAHDQVGTRFEAHIAGRLRNFALFWLWIALAGLPWIIPLAVHGLRQRVRLVHLGRERQVVVVSLLAGVAVLALVTSFCNIVSSRYILPVVPIVASLLATALAQQQAAVERTMRWILFAMCFGILALGIGLTAANIQTSHALLAGCCAAACTGLLSWLTWRYTIARVGCAALDVGLVKLAAIALVGIGVFSLLWPDEGTLIVQQFQRIDAGSETVQLIGKPSLASKMRVFDQGRTEFASIEFIEPGYCSPHETLVISSRAAKEKIDLHDFEVTDFSTCIGRVKERELLRALIRGQLGSYLSENHKRCYLAIRRSDTARLSEHREHSPAAAPAQSRH